MRGLRGHYNAGNNNRVGMSFPVDVRFIHEAEGKLGAKFPATFVVRMVKNNGGEVAAVDDSWELHPFLDTSDRKRLARTCNDIVQETRKARTGEIS